LTYFLPESAIVIGPVIVVGCLILVGRLGRTLELTPVVSEAGEKKSE
jgi:hypothetical protein